MILGVGLLNGQIKTFKDFRIGLQVSSKWKLLLVSAVIQILLNGCLLHHVDMNVALPV